jgi:DNA polymerase-3 subunit alpha
MRLTTEDIIAHKEGLIISSACMGGLLNPRNGDEWDYDLAYDRAKTFQDVFGEDFYVELQLGTDEEQKKYNQNMLDLATDLGISAYVTEDSHYVNKDEADTHRKWLGIDEDSTYYQTDDYYIHSEQQARDALSYLDGTIADELIEETERVADKCEQVEIPFGEKHYPVFEVPDGETPLSQMCKLVADGFKKKIVGHVPESEYPKYKAQIDHEIKVLDKIDYTNYMLMTEDFVRGCHDLGIRTGIGRGSVGGCLVAYLMDITRIDPIKYGLIFERFAHDKRSSSADIDTDVPNSRRGDAIQYLVDKYHEVYHVRTFGLMGERAAIQRAARSLGYEPSAIRNLPKTIEEQTDERLKDLAMKYVGIIQNYGCHASAVMLFSSDPTEWCAIEKQGEDYVCAYEYHDLEAMGLLKEDVLGIKTLDVIDNTCKMVEARYGASVDVDNLPDTDTATFDMLNHDDVLGCFQIESGGMRKIIQDIKPQNVFDIVPLVALYRPSTIQSGMVDEFTNRRKGQPFTYIHPWVEDCLKDTYGVMLYQEQAMQIVQAIAGYDLGQADVFRRAIGRKIPEEMAKLVPQFVNDCEKRGVSQDVAQKLAEWLSNAAAYQFNKSHSAAYGYTCYQTAYLKAHYPAEFLCAYLNAYNGDKQEDLLVYVNDARRHGIKILPPDARSHTCDWEVVDDKTIRMAINYISGIGDIPVPLDYQSYKKLPKDKVENLIKAGALDFLGDRSELLQDVYQSGTLDKLNRQLSTVKERIEKNKAIYETAKDGTKKKKEAHKKYLDYSSKYWDIEQKIKEVKNTDEDYDYKAGELEVLGMTFEDIFADYDTSKYQAPDEQDKRVRIVLGVVRRIKHWKQKNGKPMMFFTLECPDGTQHDMVMFNSVYVPIETNKIYRMSVVGNKFRSII